MRRRDEHREQLEALARALLEHETLDEVDAYGAAGFQPPEPSSNGASPVASAFRRIAFGHDAADGTDIRPTSAPNFRFTGQAISDSTGRPTLRASTSAPAGKDQEASSTDAQHQQQQ